MPLFIPCYLKPTGFPGLSLHSRRQNQNSRHFNCLKSSHPRCELNWKLEILSFERVFVYFSLVVLRLYFKRASPRGQCIIHAFSLLNYSFICLAKCVYHSWSTRCLRYGDLMWTVNLEISAGSQRLSRENLAIASSDCDKKSTDSNLVLCVFRATCSAQMNYTKPRTYCVGIVWVLAVLDKRRLSEIDLSGEQYKKVYFGLPDISRGSITMDDKLLCSQRRDSSLWQKYKSWSLIHFYRCFSAVVSENCLQGTNV